MARGSRPGRWQTVAGNHDRRQAGKGPNERHLCNSETTRLRQPHMTTFSDSRISRLLHVDRDAAIEELRLMAEKNPAEFLEMLALLLDQADRATQVAPTGPIQFV